MNKLICLTLLLSACAQVDVTTNDCGYEFSPGKYQFTIDNTSSPNYFCSLYGIGEIDFSSKDAFIASCPVNSTCDTDLFDTGPSCRTFHFSVIGFTSFECSFALIDKYIMVGECTDDWGSFICTYDTFIDKEPPRE